MKFFSIVLLSAGLTLAPVGALAFDKCKHIPITERVIDVYNQYAAHNQMPVLDVDARKALEKGSVAEDYPSFTRAKNWHFYDAELGKPHEIKTKSGFLGVTNRSLHVHFNDLIDELQIELKKEKINKKNVYKQLGRILHYIEDMGVPSHVAPIYHAKPEWYIRPLFWLSGSAILPDGFDAYDKDQVLLANVVTSDFLQNYIYSLVPKKNPDVKSQINAFLAELATDTRNAVTSDSHWKKFWQIKGDGKWGDDSEEKGFVRYPDGESLRFSTTSKDGLCKGDMQAACNDFYIRRMQDTLKKSVELIAYVQNKFESELKGK